MDSSFYVYFTSSVNGFDIALAERLHFNDDGWCCGLVDIYAKKIVKNPLYLCSDICQPSFVNDRKLPVIARISKQSLNRHVTYTRITTDECDHLRLYFIESNGQLSSFRDQTLHGILHFKRMRK